MNFSSENKKKKKMIMVDESVSNNEIHSESVRERFFEWISVSVPILYIHLYR